MKPINVYCQLLVSVEGSSIMNEAFLGMSDQEANDYYYNKLCGVLILKDGIHTSREDQDDFQYIFELGLKAYKAGMKLEKNDLGYEWEGNNCRIS